MNATLVTFSCVGASIIVVWYAVHKLDTVSRRSLKLADQYLSGHEVLYLTRALSLEQTVECFTFLLGVVDGCSEKEHIDINMLAKCKQRVSFLQEALSKLPF